AVGPEVTAVVPQPATPPPVAWLQTLSQSSFAGGVCAVFVADCASPSSWNMPVSWTACAAYGTSNVRTIAPTRGSTRKRLTCRIRVAPVPRVIAFSLRLPSFFPGRRGDERQRRAHPLWARSRCHGASHLLRPGVEMEQQRTSPVNDEEPDHHRPQAVTTSRYDRSVNARKKRRYATGLRLDSAVAKLPVGRAQVGGTEHRWRSSDGTQSSFGMRAEGSLTRFAERLSPFHSGGSRASRRTATSKRWIVPSRGSRAHCDRRVRQGHRVCARHRVAHRAEARHASFQAARCPQPCRRRGGDAHLALDLLPDAMSTPGKRTLALGEPVTMRMLGSASLTTPA